MEGGSRRAVGAAFLANFGIAAAKLAAFLVTGAASMVAETLHSVADTGNQALLLEGARRARRPPDEQHPFGHGAERYFWGFVVALVLFSGGALLALAEGIDKLVRPHPLDNHAVALVVLAVAVGLESVSFHTARRAAQPLRGGLSWWRFVRRSKSPELPVVLLEDAGALVGLLCAAVGVGLAWLTGEPRWDALGGGAIGVLLGAIAILLATEMKSLLIGEAATDAQQALIRDAISAAPGVARLIHLRTLHLGPEQLLVGAKVELDAASIPELAAAIDRLEARIRAAVPIATVVYVEPDRYRPRDRFTPAPPPDPAPDALPAGPARPPPARD